MGWCEGKVAVVTGAARGLGAAYAAALREAGATVVGCDVLPGTDAVADVSEPVEVRRFVDGVAERHGRIDICVANAGVCSVTGPLDPWDQALADYRHHFGTNTYGTYLMGRAVAPLMAAAGDGHIVIASTDHVLPPPGRPSGGGSRLEVYDASKWALRGFVEGWALALARHGVRVNALCMGATDSAMLRGFVGSAVTDEIVATWMRPEAVAGVLVALLEEGPGGRTGEHIGIWVGHPVGLPARRA